MATYEIWLDESGDFNHQDTQRVPSLVGGTIVKDVKLTEELAKIVLDSSKAIHAAEMNNKDLNQLLNVSINNMQRLNIKPIIFENKERVSIIDPQTTYLTVFAEGIMQLITDLTLGESKSVFNLYIARRMYKNESVLTRMKDTEYISRLDERISLLKIKNPKLINFEVNIKLGSARDDSRLMISDLICHTWYSKSYKLTPVLRESLIEFVGDNYYTILEPGGLASIKNKIKIGAYGEGLYEWLGHYHELVTSNNGTRENLNKLIMLKNQLCKYIKNLSRSEQNMQLNIISNFIKALVNHNRQYELVFPYVNIFFNEVITAMKEHKIDTSRIEAEAHFSLITLGTKIGDVQLVQHEIKEIEILIEKLSGRWENLDFIFEYYIRKGSYLNSIYDFNNGISLMDKLENMVSGIAEISASILTDELEAGKGNNVSSILLGKIYGVRSQMYLKMGFGSKEYLDLAEKDCLLAIEQFESESDKTRHYQTLAQIEIHRGNYFAAEEFISRSLSIIPEYSSDDIFKKINQLDSFNQSFYWMHYLSILSAAFMNGKISFAKGKFEKVKQYIDLNKYDGSKYPDNLIIAKYAICLIYNNEVSSAVKNIDRTLMVDTTNEENPLMILLKLNILAYSLYGFLNNNKLDMKYMNKCLKITDKLISKMEKLETLPDSIRDKLYNWQSIFKDIELNKIIEMNKLTTIGCDF